MLPSFDRERNSFAPFQWYRRYTKYVGELAINRVTVINCEGKSEGLEIMGNLTSKHVHRNESLNFSNINFYFFLVSHTGYPEAFEGPKASIILATNPV